jgi:hypothetical protein
MLNSLQRLCLFLVLDLSVALAHCFPAEAQVASNTVQNANPNYTAIRAYDTSSGMEATLRSIAER